MTDQKEVILKAIIYEIVIATGDEGTSRYGSSRDAV